MNGQKDYMPQWQKKWVLKEVSVPYIVYTIININIVAIF